MRAGDSCSGSTHSLASAKTPPAGPDWLHEIKHDGFRIPARRACGSGQRFRRSCSRLIDGEPIVTDEAGLAVLELLRSWRHAAAVPST